MRPSRRSTTVAPLARIAVLVAATACSVTPIPFRPSIRVPPALTMADVEAAIVAVLAPEPGGAPAWTMESHSPAIMYASYTRGEQYVRVAIGYTPAHVDLEIVAGRNVGFDGVRIDPEALGWVDELEQRVRASLGAAG